MTTLTLAFQEALHESLILSWTTKNPTLRAAFANKQVRFAFSHASDRASISEEHPSGPWHGDLLPVLGQQPLHIERPGQKADVLAKWEQAKKRFDLKKAAEILDSLGIKDTNGDGIRDIPANFANDFGPQNNPPGPFKFELNTNVGNTLREEMIKLLASDLKKIGIEVTAVPKDFAALTDQLTVGDYEAILIGLPDWVRSCQRDQHLHLRWQYALLERQRRCGLRQRHRGREEAGRALSPAR
jgi:peptide/nickel transport system substrate-binding protein